MLQMLVADSNGTMRLGIRTVFSAGRVRVDIDEVANHDGLIMQLGSRHYDLVLVDPMIAEGSAASLIRRILEAAPRSRILVFSSADEATYGASAIRAGAKGYLMKTCSTQELLTAVSRVSRGNIYSSPELAVEILVHRHRDASSIPHERLTQRERQVFAMQVCGMAVKDVARRLKLSAKTVSTHKARAMLKLGTNTLTEMVQYAIDQGILEDCKARCASPLPN
jgi:DNA-binding NarL/FixJ family response regulator